MLYNTVLIYGHLERLQCSTHCFESRLLFSCPKAPKPRVQSCPTSNKCFFTPLGLAYFILTSIEENNARKSLVSFVSHSLHSLSLINFKSLINFQFDTPLYCPDWLTLCLGPGLSLASGSPETFCSNIGFCARGCIFRLPSSASSTASQKRVSSLQQFKLAACCSSGRFISGKLFLVRRCSTVNLDSPERSPRRFRSLGRDLSTL